MEARATPALVIPSRCTLGEGPVWDDRECCLWWTDIQERKLLRWDWNSQSLREFALEERLGSLGLTSDPDWLICAFASGFALYCPGTRERRWIARLEPVYRGIRFNDGRVDPLGRFWAGSMVENVEAAGEVTGSLYRLDPDGKVHHIFDGIGISNSICFSRSGPQLHFADSTVGTIRRFDLGPDGSPGTSRDFARVEGSSAPDGSDCDAQGNLWNAEWGGGRITCYRPDGAIAEHLVLPVSQPTCIAFGGPDLDHLFVTTARDGLSQGQLTEQPLAGDTLVYRLSARGLPAARFPFEHLSMV